jgi:osmotically-inducible protein OsmY
MRYAWGLASALALVGCDHAPPKAQGRTDVSDARITAAVTAGLARESALSNFPVQISTRHGEVTLSGLAPHLLTKIRATEIAAHVPGVVSIDNLLEVQ